MCIFSQPRGADTILKVLRHCKLFTTTLHDNVAVAPGRSQRVLLRSWRCRILCQHDWIDHIWRVLTAEDRHEVLGSYHRHTRAGGYRGAANVWHQDHVFKFAQRLWHVRLVLE